MDTEKLQISNSQLNPIADEKAMVIDKNVRFTILTSRLIRMEWMEDDIFQDHASFIVLNRHMPVPEFFVEEKDGWLEIKTEHLQLRYKIGSGIFVSTNLQIGFELNGVKKYWHPGMDDTGNLRGTTRTLDRIKGAINLESGIISRDGWTLVNDSEGPLFDKNNDWDWVVPRPDKSQQDLYFFGYGHDYKSALYDFTCVSGKIPIPPRYTFGYWWSRYWPYTDEDFKQLVNEFDQHDVPLDVVIIDMDWHLNFKEDWLKNQLDQAGEKKGWTGFTWNRNFFPNPEKFLGWLKRKGLKISMNLHPASGVQPHEEQYPAMAKAMGIDPNSQKYVPFDIVDKKFAENYFKILLHPFEEIGVDFWWLDWQQWSTTKIKGVTPTFWLNYVHFTDMERRKKGRPIVFHRWGGLGNHRYPVGFSGDTYIEWKSLTFQPYFTATAANVGFGYWSHDIGGHYKGISTPEMYTRWIQFGAFSPILRTHASNNPRIERRIWAFPTDFFHAMREVIELRYSLLPYIYTEARKTYDSGISICYPMYYDSPEADEAYSYKNQYMFGSQIVVSPIVKHIEEDNLTVWQTVWIPEGEWIEWFSGSVIKGPVTVTREYAIDEIPVFVKGGSIIPMQAKMNRSDEKPLDNLILSVYPGKSGNLRFYEDEGNTNNYTTGSYVVTPMDFNRDDQGNYNLFIHSAEGEFENMVKERSYEIRLINTYLPQQVLINGENVPFESYPELSEEPYFYYDGNIMATIIKLPITSIYQPIEIIAKFDEKENPYLLNGAKGKISWLRKVRKEMNAKYNEYQEWVPDILIDACQTSTRMSLTPQNIQFELTSLTEKMKNILDRIEEMTDDNPIFEPALKMLHDLEKQYFQV